jgi:hypothetical protein
VVEWEEQWETELLEKLRREGLNALDRVSQQDVRQQAEYRSGVGDSTSEEFLLFVLTPQEEDDSIVGEMQMNLCKLIEPRQRL